MPAGHRLHTGSSTVSLGGGLGTGHVVAAVGGVSTSVLFCALTTSCAITHAQKPSRIKTGRGVKMDENPAIGSGGNVVRPNKQEARLAT